MRFLLDENLDWRLRRDLAAHQVDSVPLIGWAGIENGELLKQAVEAGFDVLITMDSNMVHQQNLAKYPIAVVALRAASNRLADTRPLMPALVDNGAPFGGKGALGLSRLSVWWLRLGITVDFVRPVHPQDNGAHEQMHRVLRADIATPPAPSVAAQKPTHPSLDQLLQSPASSRSFGPARPCADLLAEQSAISTAVAKRELSVHVAEQRACATAATSNGKVASVLSDEPLSAKW
jgi:predicted nuclease of predicted toxin-antitoxin system